MYIDVDWNRFAVGNFLVIEARQVIDPEVYTDVWKDRWLLRYTTAHIKKQWGTNMKKFQGIPLPGGLMFNGQQIYDEAIEEIKMLEDEMLFSYSIPASMMIGSMSSFFINTSLAALLLGALDVWNNIPLV